MTTQAGTYALILFPLSRYALQIGRLGQLVLRPGYYMYIGSAFGPGGIRARLSHHGARAVRPHWHIDYVRAVAPLCEIWYTYDTIRREHHWAAALQQARGVSMPLRRFGASDCTCAAHFFACATPPAWRAFQRRMQQSYPDHAPIHYYRPSTSDTVTDNHKPYGKKPQA